MNKYLNKTTLAVTIAALGYFVDVFDLVLFSIVRTASLKDLGITGDGLLSEGVRLLNAQMIGMLVGGIFWGILGDKIGRIQALFGSILLYSIANIANAFVSSVPAYEALRFLSGMGLAGEIGGAITLVGELLSKERRGLGTALVATAGAFGAVVASYAGDFFHWRTMYLIGGTMGLGLLLLRVSIAESGIFQMVKSDKQMVLGNPLMLFNNRDRAVRFMGCIFIGMQFLLCWGVIATFSPEVAFALFGTKDFTSATPIALFAIGVTIGDITCGVVSQMMKSRKKPLYLFALAQAFCWFGLINLNFGSPAIFNAWFLPMGFFGGLWAVLVTTASEQYGTNLRATVTTIVPNAIRGMTVPISMAFLAVKGSYDVVTAIYVVGAGCLALALIGTAAIRESFGIPLNFIELKGGGQQAYSIPSGRRPVTPAQAEEDLPVAEGWR